MWCGAAVTYARRVIKQPRRPHCAIITVPVTHLDTQTLSKSVFAMDAGLRATRLSCLLANAVALSVESALNVELPLNQTSATGWMLDPKSMGYFGPDGYNAKNPPHMRLRQKLLSARAALQLGTPCKPTRSQRLASFIKLPRLGPDTHLMSA